MRLEKFDLDKKVEYLYNGNEVEGVKISKKSELGEALALVFIVTIIGFVIALIFILFDGPEFEVVDYEIHQGINVFTVNGNISLSGYDCEMVSLTATAIDNYGQQIYLADKIYINGDGVYAFAFQGYYLDDGTSISDIKNFAVRER